MNISQTTNFLINSLFIFVQKIYKLICEKYKIFYVILTPLNISKNKQDIPDYKVTWKSSYCDTKFLKKNSKILSYDIFKKKKIIGIINNKIFHETD